LCIIALLGFAAPTAQAASPTSGKLTRSKRSVTWSGGPFVLSEPNYAGSACIAGRVDPTCDHFMLTVNMPEGSHVQVKVATARPEPSNGITGDGDDYDLYVYSPDGGLMGIAETPGGNERLTFRHRATYNGKAYEVRVGPWFVYPGSTYKGTATLID
jgi:hypothetical protein